MEPCVFADYLAASISNADFAPSALIGIGFTAPRDYASWVGSVRHGRGDGRGVDVRSQADAVIPQREWGVEEGRRSTSAGVSCRVIGLGAAFNPVFNFKSVADGGAVVNSTGSRNDSRTPVMNGDTPASNTIHWKNGLERTDGRAASHRAGGSWRSLAGFVAGLFALAVAGASWAGGADSMQIFNPAGGVAPGGSDGLRWWIGSNSQLQVQLANQTQVYNPPARPTSGVLFNTVLLRVDRGTDETTRVYHNSDLVDVAGHANGDLPFTQVSQSAISGSGTAASPWQVTTVLRPSVADDSGITVTIVDRYVNPQSWLTRRVTLSGMPATGASIKLYQHVDTYLLGGDEGPGFTRTSAWNTTDIPDVVGVIKGAQFQALWYEPSSGTPPWNRYSSEEYWRANVQICRGSSTAVSAPCVTGTGNLLDIVDPDPETDNGIAAQWDVPPGATAFTAEYRLTFAMSAVDLTKAFAPAAILSGDVSTLTFNLNNRTVNAVSSIGFTDTMPAQVQVAAVPNVRTNCPAGGGPLVGTLPSVMTVTAAPGGSVIQVAGASVDGALPGDELSCQIAVDVTSSVPGKHHNTNASIGGIGNLVNLVGDETLEVFGPPFTCDARMYLSQSPINTINTTLYDIDTAANPFTFPAIGQGSVVYNASGFNPADNYIYAISYGNAPSNSLIRVDADGGTANLGAVSGLPAGFYNSGDFSIGGVYYVVPAGGGAVNTMYAIDVGTLTATAISLSATIQPSDIAWVGGLLYTVSPTGQLMSITPGGTVTNIGSPSGAITLGAMFGAPNGLFASANGGGFYQIDLLTGARTLISGSPGSTVNDGAHCTSVDITFDADLAITKTDGSATYTPGTNTVYSIVASNNGPFGAQNAHVQDALPAGVATANWTCAAANGAVCRTGSGSGAIDARVDLPFNTSGPAATATFTLTMAVPAGFTGDLVNTATVAPDVGNTDPNPDNDSATDIDVSTPRLTLVKQVDNGDGGTALATDWTLSAAGPSSISGVTGSAAVTGAWVTAGTYVLSESAGPAGYTPGAWSCDAGTLTGSTLILANGQDVTCTIVNDDQPATLTLVKTVINDDGGVATAADFPLTATGPTSITGVSGTSAVTAVAVTAGSYVLSEGNLAGYTAGAWSCDAGALAGSTLVLASGENATCTIVNNDQPVTLTLSKTLINDNGGVATLGDFMLSAAGPTPINGTSGSPAVTAVPVSAGTYTLSETNVSGYTASAWTCTGGALVGSSLQLTSGQTADCAITNDDDVPVVTLVKTVADASGNGIAEPDEVLTYTITLTNSTGTAFTDYDFVENVPVGATLTSVTGPGVTTSACALPLAGAGTCNVTVASVPASGSTPVTVQFTVADPIPAGITSITNLVNGGDTTCGEAGNGCEVSIPTAGTVTLVKALAAESGGTQPGIAEPGETLTWTITLTNTGGSAVTAYGVTDQLDANTTFASADNGGSHSAGVVTWIGLTVPPQIGATPGTLVLTVTATVNTPIPAGVVQIANLAYETGTTPPACPPAGPGCVVTPTTGQLSVAKALSGESIAPDGMAQPGEELTYTITLRNTGGSAVSNVLVNEWVPMNTTFVSGTPGWSCATGSPGGTACDALVDIAAGVAGNPALVTLTFTVRVADPLPVGVTRIGNVVALNDQPPVDCASNPTAPQCVQTQTVNLSLSKTVQSVTATGPGSYSVSYLIEVTNTGGSATTYTLTDTLGFATGVGFNGLGLLTTTGGTLNPAWAGGSFSPVNGVVLQISATAVPLPAATVHRYTVSVPVAVNPGGVQNASCSGSAGNGFYNAAALTGPMNLSTSTCAPVAVDDVRIRLLKTVLLDVDANHNGYGDAGDVLGYTFVIDNPGTQPLSAIQLIDPRVEDIACGPLTTGGAALTVLRSDTISAHPFESLGDLAPGDAMTCRATYTLTAADVASRRVVNVATTAGSAPAGQVATSTSTAIFVQFR